MILDQSPANPATALELAELMILLSQSNAQTALDTALATALGGPVQSWHAPFTATTPGFYCATDGARNIILIEGCSTLLHGSLTLDGYSGGLLDSLANPRNIYFEDLADLILGAANGKGLTPGNLWVIAGHSLGGAVAQIIAGRVKATSRLAGVNVCTFGAPKPTAHAFCAEINSCDTARWMNDNDPVPLIPPSSLDSLAVLLVFSVRENQRFQNFDQPHGGIQLFAGGTTEARKYPDTAAINTVTNLAAWLASIDQARNTAHDMPAYVSRLAFIVNQAPPSGPPPAPTDESGADDAASRRSLTDSQKRVLQRLVANEAARHAGPRSIPLEVKAQSLKVGNVWQVQLAGEMIAVTSRRRTAASIVRKFNAMLGAVLQQGLVSKEGVKAGVDKFLDMASTPGSGVRPQLPTELPT